MKLLKALDVHINNLIQEKSLQVLQLVQPSSLKWLSESVL